MAGTQNILIGVGGTGARCVEAFIHLSVAGLVDGRTWVGLVDQDQTNGNSTKSTTLLSAAIDLRKRLRRSEASDLGSESPFFSAELTSPVRSALWLPFAEMNPTLRSFFAYNLLPPGPRSLMDVLYEHKTEQELLLDVGFCGRPNIGAAIVTARASAGEDEYWRDLLDVLRAAARGGQDTRVFVVGSIFGGTGAAGLPTIARLLKRLVEREQLTAVRVGGGLMLPYFNYGAPPAGDDRVIARSDDFLENSQDALRYYARVLSGQRVFDRLYAIGWSPLISLPYLDRGGERQTNPSLIPELYAALAAANFFTDEAPTIGESRVMVAGRRANALPDWSDLPSPKVGEAKLRQRLGQLVRFAAAFQWIYSPALVGNMGGVAREGWYQGLIASAGASPTTPEAQALIAKLNDYCTSVLRWVGELSLWSDTKQLPLFDVRAFAERLDPRRESELTRIRAPSTRSLAEAFPVLVGGPRASSLSDIFEELTYSRPRASERGVGAFISALHRACSIADG